MATSVCFIWAQSHTADANGYYQLALGPHLSFGLGTDFALWLTQTLLIVLATKVQLYLAFSLLGFAGILLLAASMKKCAGLLKSREQKILAGLLFLPGPHFWTSMIGKDGITFLGTSIIVYTLAFQRNRIIGTLFGTIMCALVRPHIALLMAGCMCAAVLLAKSRGILLKVLAVCLLGITTYLSIDFVADYVGIQGAVSASSVERFVEKRQSDLTANSAVDLTDTILPLRVFLFLFTPLFVRGLDPLRLIVSTENLILIGVATYCIAPMLKVVVRSRHILVLYSLIFFSLGSLILSSTITNQGLALRQKMMLFPSLYIIFALCLWVKSQSTRTR